MPAASIWLLSAAAVNICDVRRVTLIRRSGTVALCSLTPVGLEVGRSAVGILLAVTVVAACSDDSGQSCDKLRAEYERLYPQGDSTAWSDIRALQVNVAEGIRLRDRIEEQCG